MSCFRPRTSYSSRKRRRRSTASRGGMPCTMGPQRSYVLRNWATSFLNAETVLIKSFLYSIWVKERSFCFSSHSWRRSSQFFWYIVRRSASSLPMMLGRFSSKIRYMCSIGTNSSSISLSCSRTSRSVAMTEDNASMSPRVTSRESFFRVRCTISEHCSSLKYASLWSSLAKASFQLLASSLMLLLRLVVCNIRAEIWCEALHFSTSFSNFTKYFNFASKSSKEGSCSLNFVYSLAMSSFQDHEYFSNCSRYKLHMFLVDWMLPVSSNTTLRISVSWAILS
mmetsp:Transcript_39915/g.120575  ORF Transcript_39915/g.120575 Transcript_39915/m.120575 type:complete len:281 (+) Transcript_39915:8385-9227(+)